MWADSDEGYADTRIIFVDTETSNWTFDEARGQYFWHRFFSHQPDLNYDEPAVVEAVLDVLRFWADKSVDGFRLDAIPYLIEREGTNCENLPGTHDIVARIREALDREYQGIITIAEANQMPEEVVEYFGTPERPDCTMCLHFPVMPRIYRSLREGTPASIRDVLARTPQIPAHGQWGTFLRNHDELTLEMVDDEERALMYGWYAPEDRMRANVGIRRRLAPLLGNSRDEIELAHALLLSLPGSPCLYYGDEIGMGENIWLEDRDAVRTPMQWDSSANAGFSTAADPSALTLPSSSHCPTPRGPSPPRSTTPTRSCASSDASSPSVARTPSSAPGSSRSSTPTPAFSSTSAPTRTRPSSASRTSRPTRSRSRSPCPGTRTGRRLRWSETDRPSPSIRPARPRFASVRGGTSGTLLCPEPPIARRRQRRDARR